MDLTKEEFFEKYKNCGADRWAMDKIWKAWYHKSSKLSLSFGYGLSDISFFELDGWENLRELTLHRSRVSDLSPLRQLTNLEELDISKTNVSDLEPLENLVNLECLDLSYSKVADLKPIIKLIRKLEVKEMTPSPLYYKGSIYVKDIPIHNPPLRILEQGSESILRYWRQQEEQKRVGLVKIKEARLLLVGQGGSGKTTLRVKLKDKKAPMPMPEETTKGISIDNLSFKPNLDDPSVNFEIEEIETQTTEGVPFTVKVWDFGGQNIQHYAHQFFMSDSAVYAVLSNTREQNSNFQYWLNIIELLGKDSPFFIVQNEREGHKEPLRDVVKIQERFPETFQTVEQVNLKEAAVDQRFEALKAKLLHAATQLPHTQREVLTSFFKVREKLEGLAQQHEQTISFKEFQKLCADEGIEDRELMTDYARLMTELGIALHFHDDIHLRSQVFLNPKWIIDALFELLYHPSIVEQSKGHFTVAEADQIWSRPEYDDMHGVLLQLMVKFRLCYETHRRGQYIVPQRLPTREIAFVPPVDATHLIYKYKFLPSGLMTQLTCSLHDWIEDERVWSDAVQFTTKNRAGWVFARENSEEHKIELFAFGLQKADMLNRVVDALDAIHRETKLKNLVWEKLIPCLCLTCKHHFETHFFKYEVLKRRLQKNNLAKIACDISDETLFIAEILKNANIRFVKLEEVKENLSQHKIEKTLNLLRGMFPNNKELIIQESRWNQLSSEDRIGIIGRNDKNSELAKLIVDILTTAKKILEE